MAGGILIWRRKRYAGETHQRTLATHTLLKEAKTALKQNDPDRFAKPFTPYYTALMKSEM